MPVVNIWAGTQRIWCAVPSAGNKPMRRRDGTQAGCPRVPCAIAAGCAAYGGFFVFQFLRLPIVIPLLACLCLCSVDRANAEAETTLRLRIAWGGAGFTQWTGTIGISEGQLTEVRPLGVEADEPGSFWLQENEIRMVQRSPRAYDAVETLVSAPISATLTVALNDAESGSTFSTVVSLADLVSRHHIEQIDEGNNRLLVQRAPGDAIRVRTQHPSMVFDSGESVALDVGPHLVTTGDAGELQLRCELIHKASQSRVWTQDFSVPSVRYGETAWVPISLALPPQQEGVYEILMQVLSKRPFLVPTRTKVFAERRVQLTAVSRMTPLDETDSNVNAPTEVIFEVNPFEPPFWRRLGKLEILPGSRREPFGNGKSTRWEHPELGTLIRLARPDGSSDIAWEAYPLAVERIGEPHILEVEMPADLPQSMSVSIMEPNAAGAVVPIGLDSGVYTSGESTHSGTKLHTHRLVFWPRTREPLVLLANRSQSVAAHYGSIRVLASKTASFLSTAPPGKLPSFFSREDQPAGRLLAGYMDRPLFTENFSAPEVFDNWNNRSLDDWSTFYQGGLRLVEYLRYVGFNGLMLTAYADGSGIYPSEVLTPTPRYDTGAFLSLGQDPVRKDVLELLFRLFNRHGLKLIPSLDFNAPIDELESARRDQPATTAGLEWVGSDGKTWTQTHATRQSSAPHYNILHPAVQKSVRAAVDEIVNRYGHHSSFGGVAIKLSEQGFMVLPGMDWGYDDYTVAEFEKGTQIELPGKGPDRFLARARAVRENHLHAWLKWRSKRLRAFYKELEEECLTGHPNARLYLAGSDLFTSPAIQNYLQPSLLRREKLDDALLALGIEPNNFADGEKLVFMRPTRITNSTALAESIVDLEINQVSSLDRELSAGRSPAALLYHPPHHVRLRSFEEMSPFQSIHASLYSQLVPAGAENRMRFAHALATLDVQEVFDGGWLLPMGQQDALREFVHAYSRLPAKTFETITDASQLVTMRVYSGGSDTYMYIVNDSPWPASTEVMVEAPADAQWEALGIPFHQPKWSTRPGGFVWKQQLRPYDLVALRVDRPNVRLTNPRTEWNGDIRQTLARRIADLADRTRHLTKDRPLPDLPNADFEKMEGTGEDIPGWQALNSETVDPSKTVELEDDDSAHGAKSVHLRARGGSAGIQAMLFAAPLSGRLDVQFYAKTTGKNDQPKLRIVVEEDRTSGGYSAAANLGGKDPHLQLSTEWRPIRIKFSPPPLPDREYRLKFEVVGDGDVWLDDIRLRERPISPDEYNQLLIMINGAKINLDEGRYAQCKRFLDGFWPRYLDEISPVAELAVKPQTDVLSDRPQRKEQPGMFDRFRDSFPRFLRLY